MKVKCDLHIKRNVHINENDISITYKYEDLSEKEVEKVINKIKSENTINDYGDRIKEFLECEFGENGEGLLNKPTTLIFQTYKEWCIKNDVINMTNIEFGKLVCELFNCESKVVKLNGKSTRVYIKN